MTVDIPRLTGARLVLRGHEESDHAPAFAMWSDPAVVRYIGGRAFTREEVWHRILRYIGHWSLRPYGYWAIEERATGTFVGEIGFADWKRDSITLDCPEGGWALVPGVHGRGYAGEAMELAHAWADAAGIDRLACIIQPENVASIRLAERFGYVAGDQTSTTGAILFDRRRADATA